jgi:hypothetical protein
VIRAGSIAPRAGDRPPLCELHLRLSASTLDFCRRIMTLPGRRLLASAKSGTCHGVVRDQRDQLLDARVVIVPHLYATKQILISTGHANGRADVRADSSQPDLRREGYAQFCRPRHVRFTPDSGHSADELACPFCANCGHADVCSAATEVQQEPSAPSPRVVGSTCRSARRILGHRAAWSN